MQGGGGHSSQLNKDQALALQKQGLLKHVFSWTALDIMNDAFLSSKVTLIPTEFESLNNYFTSFHWPLLEEVRAQIKESLELIGEAPCVPLRHVKGYKMPRSKKGSESEFFMRLKIFMREEQLIKNKIQKREEKFMFRSKDLLLLSNSPHGSRLDGPGCSAQRSLFAFVEKAEEDETLTVLVSKFHAEDAFRDVMDEKENWYATYLVGLATQSRIWRALNPTDMKKPIFAITGSILKYHPGKKSSKNEDLASTKGFKHMVARYCSSACRLNESQTNAVASVMKDIEAGLNSGVRMIQGPPGTGKTSTVVTLLSVAVSINKKCLVACPTNTAVAEVALRFLKLLEHPGGLQFGEFCSSWQSRAENSASTVATWKILKTSDIVLVGNEERLPLQGKLKDIYLPYKVELIHTANKSWKEVASSLLSFIVSIESRYKEQMMKDMDPGQKTSLLQFARSSLKQPIKSLGEHGRTLARELPNDHAEQFLELAELAEDLLHNIQKPTVPEQGFLMWFSKDELRKKLVKRLGKCLKVKRGHLSHRESIERLCMKCSSLIFCTVSSAGRKCLDYANPFDCLIIDEAAQLVEAETAIAACLSGLNHAILFGDHQQLPATVISKVAADCGYGRSLFERMMSLDHPCHLLSTQYRMHPEISLFPNLSFYQGCLRNGENVTSPSYKLYENLLYGSYAFIDVKGGAEKSDHDRKSKRNSLEAVVVLNLVKMLSEACKNSNNQNLTVGVITPYSSQKDHLQRCLDGQQIKPLMVDINSVDGFQGQERDVIIISTVRANNHGAIGFLKDYRRLNVAMTRARFCLWIVGCGKTLKAEHSVWTDLLEDAVDRNLYREAATRKPIRKKSIKLKKDSNAYSELLQTNSALFINMLWKVVFSPGFKNSFLQLKSADKKDKIITSICSLSSGKNFSPHKIDCVPIPDKIKGLIEVHRVADLYLIWGVEVEIDVKATQILKMWDIVDHSKLSKRMDSLQGAYNAYSDDSLDRCKVRHFSRETKLTIPETWEEDPGTVWMEGSQQETSQRKTYKKKYVRSGLIPKQYDTMSLDTNNMNMMQYPLSAQNMAHEILPCEMCDEDMELSLDTDNNSHASENIADQAEMSDKSIELSSKIDTSETITSEIISAEFNEKDVKLSLDLDDDCFTPENQIKEETFCFHQKHSSFRSGESETGKITEQVVKLAERGQQHQIPDPGLCSTDGPNKKPIKQNLATSSPYIAHQITNNSRGGDKEAACKEEDCLHPIVTSDAIKDNKPTLLPFLHGLITRYNPVNLARTITKMLHPVFPPSHKPEPATTLKGKKISALPIVAHEELEKTVHRVEQQIIASIKKNTRTRLSNQTEETQIKLTADGYKGVQSQDAHPHILSLRSGTPNLWRTPYGYLFQIYFMMLTDSPARTEKTPLSLEVHVAIIRRQQHIWIDKQSCHQYKIILDYWLHHRSIKTRSAITSATAMDTPEDWWAKSGLKLFNWQYYKAAELCYRRAGKHQHAQLAKAGSLQQNGQNQCSTNKKKAIEKLKRAAEIFHTCGRAKRSTECYIRAGAIYIEEFRPPNFEAAGDFFMMGKSILQAAGAYFSAGSLEKCLDACLKGRHLQEGLSFIRQWRVKCSADKSRKQHTGIKGCINQDPKDKLFKQVEVAAASKEDYIKEYLQTCGTHFHKQKNVKMMFMFVDAFMSTDSKRKFLIERDYFDELLKIEEDQHNYLEAIYLAQLKGDLLYEATLLEKVGDYDNAVKKVLLFIHRDSLWGEQNRGLPFQKTQRSNELLRRAGELGALAKDSIRHEVELETLLMFQKLAGPQDVRSALTMVQTFGSIKMKLLIAWRALDILLSILKEDKSPNQQRKDLPESVQDRQTLLVKTVSIWIDWQDIIMHWKRVISKTVNLRNSLPGNALDDDIQKHCFDFYGVTYAEDLDVFFVHDLDAYWYKSQQKGQFLSRISTKVFAKLAVKFWDEQLAEKERAISDVCNLQTQLDVILWPPTRTAEDMCHIQKLRETTRFAAILDKIADQIISKHEAPGTSEERGKLQLIYPFLSEAWKRKNGANSKSRLQFWIDPPKLSPKLSVEKYAMESGNQLVKIFDSAQKSISPLVFVTLLENVAVMACACETSLHETFLPITSAFEFMCGKHQEGLYQKLLSSTNFDQKSMGQIITKVKQIVVCLLIKPSILKNWFHHVQGNETDLPSIIIRLSTIMFLFCLNSRDPGLQKTMVNELQQIFNKQSPVLQHFPQLYLKQCRQACNAVFQKTASHDESMKHFKDAFGKALISIGDGLVVTKRCKNQQCCKREARILTLRMENQKSFSMEFAALASAGGFVASISIQNCAVQIPDQLLVVDHVPKPKVSTENNVYKAFPLEVSEDSSLHKVADTIPSLSNINLSSTFDVAKEGLEQHLEPSHKQPIKYDLEWLLAEGNRVQASHSEMKQMLESDIRELMKTNPLKNGGDKEQVQEEGKDCSIANPDDSCKINSGKREDLSTVSGSPKKEASDGVSSCLADHSIEPAAKAFTEKDVYNAYLIEKAFPLKILVDSSLQTLAKKIASCNNTNLLNAFNSSSTDLQHHLCCLESSHKKHEGYNLIWLKRVFNHVQNTHMRMIQKFEAEVKKLEKRGDALKGGVDKEEVQKTKKKRNTTSPHDACKTNNRNDENISQLEAMRSANSSPVNEASCGNTSVKNGKKKAKKKDNKP